MRHNIRDNWINSFELLLKKPAIFTPFIIVAFFECLVLEIAYFSTRFPLNAIFGPIIKKFFGEAFVHYPDSLTIIPRLYYSGQVAVYVLAGVFLAAVAVQMVVNVRTGHPVIAKAIVNNTAKKYIAFAAFGVLYIVLMALLEKGEGFILLKGARFISRRFFVIGPEVYSILAAVALFLTFVIMQTLLVLTVPVIVIEKKGLFRAILGSVALGLRNFLKLFCLIVLPFFFYLPVILLNVFLPVIMNQTFPEISFYITLLSILLAVFIDCFVIVAVTQFLLNTKKTR